MLDELQPNALQGLQVTLKIASRLLGYDSFGKGDTRSLLADGADFIQNIYDRYLHHLNFIIKSILPMHSAQSH